MDLIRIKRHLIVFAIDSGLIILAWMVAYALRFNLDFIPFIFLRGMFLTLPFVLVGQIIVNYFLGIHRGSWRFCSMNDLRKIIKAAVGGLLLTIAILFISAKTALVPRSIPFIYALLIIFFLGGPRFLFRQWQEYSRSTPGQQRVLIVGAGAAGESFARDLLRNKNKGYIPVAFVDIFSANILREIHGLHVYDGLAKIPNLAKQLNIDLIVIAMPTASSQQIQQIVSFCEQAEVPFRIVPSITDLASGRITVDSLRNVSLEDLLGREHVQLDVNNISMCVRDKVVVVTGGAGSIGSELCRQIANFAPRCLLIVDSSEFNLYTIDMELSNNKQLHYIPILQDITDRDGIHRLMQHYKPDIVFHAAAYKHVPMLEHQIRIAIRNNVLGTQILAEEASAAGVGQFIMVSTDKAVHPTNIMGASKRLAEIFCQNFASHSKTRFITVRFGNVLGSAGSVVPLFKKQLTNGGPITVTHPEVTRYFMTISEAAQLILQATTLGSGGEIFVLDMGQPIKIQYLAEQIIRLAGLKVGEDIQIVYTGLRPGEKLYEELFHESEALLQTPHNKIFLAKAFSLDWEMLQQKMQAIAHACTHHDIAFLKETLAEMAQYHAEQDAMSEPANMVVE
jgi:FlaA1/EpsC-like NDP-sugar epimerase